MTWGADPEARRKKEKKNMKTGEASANERQWLTSKQTGEAISNSCSQPIRKSKTKTQQTKKHKPEITKR
jgi:hypothetical protein